jgi:hypothetical protein
MLTEEGICVDLLNIENCCENEAAVFTMTIKIIPRIEKTTTDQIR